MVLGVMGYTPARDRFFPDVAFPVVAVTVPYPGAAPGAVEQLVTRPLEEAVVSLNGIDRVKTYSREARRRSSSSSSSTSTSSRPPPRCASASRRPGKLPTKTKEPIISRIDVGAAPVITYTLEGGGRSLSETAKFARDVIKPSLEQVDGVAAVNVLGGAEREVHVDLDLARIDALHLSPIAILQQLRAQNLNVPAGHSTRALGDQRPHRGRAFHTVEAMRDTIVATTKDGAGACALRHR
ncbi:MAG: efflux RND transporter permease subunit [Myxococcales bacterium]|nr:efflux RND transporter permease subunit [Myxococcales bacterium]